MERTNIPLGADHESIDESPSDDETQVMQIEDQAGFPVLKLDADEYRKYIAEYGLTREQEDELLQAYWNIIVGFIDLGFGIKTKSRLEVALEKASQDGDSSSGVSPSIVTPTAKEPPELMMEERAKR